MRAGGTSAGIFTRCRSPAASDVRRQRDEGGFNGFTANREAEVLRTHVEAQKSTGTRESYLIFSEA